MDHLLGGRGSPLRRLRRIHPMEMKYPVKREETSKLTTELKAAVEPMLIKARPMVMLRERRIAFNGISVPTLTTLLQTRGKGMPSSRAKAKACLEAVAKMETPAAMRRTTMIKVMAVVAPLDPVAL